MVFVPNAEYIYYRVGNNHVSAILDTLSSNLIKNGLDFKTAKNIDILYDAATDTIEYDLNNDSYALVEDFRRVNDSNQATISFWLGSDDWQKPFGHEILGNYNDRGFGVFNDQLVTPFITIQDGRRVVSYNTNFDVVDTVYLSQSALNAIVTERKVADTYTLTTFSTIQTFAIRDVHRMDHLNFMLPTINSVVESLTTIEVNPVVETTCSILDTDDTTPYKTPPLMIDNNITSDNTSITGLLVEPCKNIPGSKPV